MKELDKLNRAHLTALAMKQDVTVLFRLKPTIAQRQSILAIQEHLGYLSDVYAERIRKLLEATHEAPQKTHRTATRS